jgi:hypothetical protein
MMEQREPQEKKKAYKTGGMTARAPATQGEGKKRPGTTAQERCQKRKEVLKPRLTGAREMIRPCASACLRYLGEKHLT